MRAYAFRWFCGAIGLLLLGIPLSGQNSSDNPSRSEDVTPSHLGYPQDWSSRHLVMPGVQTEDILAAGGSDPRHVYNWVMRQVAIENARRTPVHPTKRTKIDWSVSLENGFVPQNKFPAKYRFSITSESCSTDYVLFAVKVTTGTQANLVGVNNLYTEAAPPCNSGKPWVSFAYNTANQGGRIRTSPALSSDGSKVAFIESTATGSYFHVLVLPNPIPVPPAFTGTVLSPQTPTSCATPTTAGCMTTLTIQTAATDSNSSPWVDYASDTAYVGADNGLMYKIKPVFGGGAPVLVGNADWPVTVSTQPNKILTDVVIDTQTSKAFVGDGYGYLYSVSLATPAHTFAAQLTVGWVGHGAGTGVVDAPIVTNDSANPATNQVFVFNGCSTVLGIGGAVSQVPATFTTATALTTSNTVDLGSATGAGDCTGGNLHAGTFDNAFWLTGSTSGHMIACGFVSGTPGAPLTPSNPKMYFFPFAAHTITSTGSNTFIVNNTVGDECSPPTEFYNGTTDKLFFGVGSSKDGAIESSAINATTLTAPTCSAAPTATCVSAPSGLGGTSGIVIDNQLSNGGTNIYFTTQAVGSVNAQKCNVTGGSANPYCAVKLTQSALN
jgi:hypothetical protein